MVYVNFESKVFEILPDSKAMEAIKSVAKAKAQESRNHDLPQSGNLADIQKKYRKFEKAVLEKLEQKNPESLESIGLKTGLTRVFEKASGILRAYDVKPAIYYDRFPDGEGGYATRFFLFSPVDYKGKYFVPENSKLIEGDELEQVNSYLFAGGWSSPGCLLSTPEKGVVLPEGFDGANDQVIGQSYQAPKTISFLPGGQFIDILDDIECSNIQYRESMNCLIDEIKKIYSEKMGDDLLAQTDGEEYSFSVMYSLSGPVRLEISPKGKWGDTLNTPENPWFTISREKGHHHTIVPRTDTDEGKALAKKFEALKSPKELKDYIVFAALPPAQIREVKGLKILRFQLKDGENPPHLRDCKEVNEQALSWIIENINDRNIGVSPPPMPANLQNDYNALEKLIP
tara:strand:- start:1084 stop:2283 length:1200 start_codon:yes stop_codon:yes gene_type:complete